LSNILVGQAYKELKGIDTLKILAGGLPQNPVPPFNYCITWSPTDLIEEYTRPARILQNGKMKTVEALSGIEEFSLPRIGKFECFYTDGLRTLLHTLKNAKKMEEKTVRYPGHAGIFKTIIDCGFLSDEQVHCGKRLVNVHDITMEFLRNVLRKTDNKDISILKIQVSKGRRKRTYLCVDYYDEKNNITSMARMTAYTASMITQCIKEYNGYGVIPPEYLGMDEAIKKSILSGLRKHGIKVKSKK
jgi:saccharopine dehydrogenase-like NADP-dependent oxidoreductase